MSEPPRVLDAKLRAEWDRLEYAELGASYRHDDAIVYTLTGVLVPLSGAALAAAWRYPAYSVALAFTSLVLLVFYMIVVERLAAYTDQRHQRMRELEQAQARFDVGLPQHTRINDAHHNQWGRWQRVAGIKMARRALFALFAGVAIWTLVFGALHWLPRFHP